MVAGSFPSGWHSLRQARGDRSFRGAGPAGRAAYIQAFASCYAAVTRGAKPCREHFFYNYKSQKENCVCRERRWSADAVISCVNHVGDDCPDVASFGPDRINITCACSLYRSDRVWLSVGLLWRESSWADSKIYPCVSRLAFLYTEYMFGSIHTCEPMQP